MKHVERSFNYFSVTVWLAVFYLLVILVAHGDEHTDRLNARTATPVLVEKPRELVGINEASHTPQHPEFRLANIAQRARKWNNNTLNLTAGAGSLAEGQTFLVTQGGETREVTANANGSVTLDPSQSVQVTVKGRETVGSFDAQFLDSLRGLAIWRTMDLSRTNGSTQAEWTDRPTLDSPIGEWVEKGWPWEMQIEAANLAGVDPWFCVPHLASEEYADEFGQLLMAELDAERTPYIEFSNEAPWNTGPAFEQSRWMLAQTGGNVREARRFYGQRSRQLVDIIKRYVPRAKWVLSGQAASIATLEDAIEGAGTNPDVISCAAYFNPGKEGLFVDYLAGGPDDQHALDLMRLSIANRKAWWQAYGDKARELVVPLIAYEGGPHVAAAAGVERQDSVYVAWLHQLNRDPRMKEIYQLFRETWRECGGDGLLYYNRLSDATQFGSWGHQEFAGDDSPKWQAVEEHLAEHAPPAPEPSPYLILDWQDGGRGDVKDWLGRPATLYTRDTAKTLELDPPLQLTTLTVQLQVARIGVEPGWDDRVDQKRIGMCSAVKFWSTEHGGFATVDIGEPTKPAMRTRMVEKVKLADGTEKTIGLQNGSTRANAGIHGLWNDERGRWHAVMGVFNPADFRPYRSNIDNLFCYIDDQGETVQGDDTDPQLNTTFDRLTIGECDRFGGKLAIRALKITKELGTSEDAITFARSIGCNYAGGKWEDETTWPEDGRYFSLEDVPTPEPEPEPEPEPQKPTYTFDLQPDGTMIFTPEPER